MRGEIIAIGDELTSGRILNTTSYFAATQLFAAGHEIIAMTTIGDDTELIGETLQHALKRVDFIIVTGGLGATTDDLTTEAVAEALDRPTTLYPEILRKIKERGWDGPQSGKISLEKLAWLPEGAHALHTEAQMAGYFLVQGGKPVFFLPGVPHEMKELLLETVITRLAVWEGEEVRQVRQKVYKVFGLPETEINARLECLEDNNNRVRIGYYPVFPEVHVSLNIVCDSEEEASSLFQEIDTKIVEKLGTNVYGFDEETLESVVGKLLKDQGKTLAVAESCTGGLVGHTITRVAGSSDYFVGGVVAYSNDLKESLAGVDGESLRQHGAVSAETARALAEGVRRVTGADIGVSVTGIAGPSGGSKEKPVGTVYFGLATSGSVNDVLCYFSGDRWQIQEKSCHQALDLIRRSLLGYKFDIA